MQYAFPKSPQWFTVTESSCGVTYLRVLFTRSLQLKQSLDHHTDESPIRLVFGGGRLLSSWIEVQGQRHSAQSSIFHFHSVFHQNLARQ